MPTSGDLIAQVRRLKANASSFEDYAQGLASIAGIAPEVGGNVNASRTLQALRRRVAELERRVRELEVHK